MPDFSLFLISSWIQIWCVKVVLKFFNCSTFSHELFSGFILWLRPTFWSQDMTMYLVVSAFTSSPFSWLAATKASVLSSTVCTLPPNIQGIHKRIVRFQKLTRNLFLTLHGHKVHRQQQQLPKFLTRYQQFASHAYCGAAGPISKMASQQEKAFIVLRFEVSRSAPAGVYFLNRARNSRCTVITDLDTSKRSTQKAFSCCDTILETGHAASRPRSKHEKRAAGSAWETWTVAAADCVRCARVRWEINFLLTFETAPFFCDYPVLTSSA